jgi:CHAT domain-containing protein/tetratricopeptide (TPR) repeat protein
MTAAPSLAESLRAANGPSERRAVLRVLRPEPGAWAPVLLEARRVRRENPAEAAMLARQALLAARLGRRSPQLAEASRALGLAYHVLGRPAAALRHLRQAFDRALPGERPPLAADLASALATLGRPDEARALLADARRGLKGSKTARARVLLDISEATLLERLDRHRDALVLLDRARSVVRHIDHRPALASIDHNRANVLANLAEHEQAERIFRRVTAYHSARGESAAALQSEYNRTYVLFLRGRFHEALRRLRDLKSAFLEGGDLRHAGLCDLDEAELLLRMNLYAEARTCADRAREVFARLGMSQEAARARFFAAAATRNLEEGEPATQELERCHAELNALGMEAWSALSLFRLAEADRHAGRNARARERAAEAGRQLRALSLFDRAARADVLLARLSLDEGRPAEALVLLSTSRRNLGHGAHPWVQCELHHAAARAARALGRRWPALAHALRAVRIVERHRLTVPPDEYMAAFLRDKAAVYEEAVRCLLWIGGDRATVRAWELAEQAKSRALLDLLQHRVPGNDRTRAGRLLRRADELRGQIDGLLNDLPSPDGRTRSGDVGLRAEAVGLRERWLDECLDRLEAVAPAAARLRRAWRPSLSEVSASLGDDTTLVEYFLADESLTAFVLARGHLHVVRTDVTRERVEQLVARARFHLDRPDAVRDAHGAAMQPILLKAALHALAELHDAVLAPVRDRIATPRLLIVPHGALHGVPFQALCRDGRSLLEDHEVVLVPSAAIWLHCRRETPALPKRGGCAVLGIPDERAPLIADEVERVRAIHPGSRARLGVAADRAALARLGRNANLVHLACHAAFREGEPLLSGLLLGDGWLTLPEIYDLRLSAEVLVLSGCATGRAWVSEGDDLFGLVRGFLHAGVRNLVASLWPVSDASAARFMEAFHLGLARGDAPSVALREAATAVRALFPHPHDWAPFVLIGTGSASTRSHS